MSMMQTGLEKLNSSGAPETRAGKTSKFTQVNFPTPFPDGSSVIVIPMVQTFNGQDTPGVRIARVTTSGFKIRMNELVASGGKLIANGNHNKETIGWVAFTV